MSYNSRLREARKNAGLTQTELGNIDVYKRQPFTAFRRSGAEYHDEALSLCPAADAGIDDGFFRAAAQKDGCKTGSECLKLSL